jgi:hypothetical protein
MKSMQLSFNFVVVKLILVLSFILISWLGSRKAMISSVFSLEYISYFIIIDPIYKSMTGI